MQVIDKLNTTRALTLSRALLVYTGKQNEGCGSAESVGSDDALVTISDIFHGEYGPTIGPGQLLDRSALSELVRQINGLPQRRELLSERVLFADSSRMLWYCPSALRPLWFSNRYQTLNKTVKNLIADLNGAVVLHPPLLFLAEPGEISIFALASDKRPIASDPVFVAPYLNLYDRGNMCLGNVRLPKALSVSDLATWEAAFFETQFTHSNYRSVKLCQHPRGHDGLWRSLRYRQTWRGFPSRFLTPMPTLPKDGQKDKKTTLTVLTVEGVLNQ